MKISHHPLILVLSLFFVQRISAQNFDLLLDGSLGYKSNISDFGFFGVGVSYKERLELRVGPALTWIYGGNGFTAGIKYNFYPEKRLFFSGEVSYRNLFPSKIDISWDNDSRFVTYHVPSAAALVPQIGVNYDIMAYGDGMKKVILSFNVDYLFPLGTVQAQYVSGENLSSIEKSINNRYREGLGFSFVLTAYLHRHQNGKHKT